MKMRKITLIDQNEELVAAWKKEFNDLAHVEVKQGNICEEKCSAIVSPANSFGFMDGGLDYALSERFGWDLQKMVQEEIQKLRIHELLVGEGMAFVTNDPDVPYLIVAPTMRAPMRITASINAYLAMKAILAVAIGRVAIETVAIPGLGTGVGKTTIRHSSQANAQGL
jgi:O-acetyl-ADP-ribose deacetylase (regulator of RNase III)